MTTGRWSDCTLAMHDVIQAWGTGLSGTSRSAGSAPITTRASGPRPIGPDDARSLYDWRRADRRGALRSRRLDRVRGDVLSSAQCPSRAGMRGTWPRISKLS
jgi:hypothetical protein